MLTFDKIKLYFTAGLWTEAMVQKAAEKGVITQEQATGIVEGGR